MEGHESHSESGEGNRSRYVTALSSDDVNERNDRVFMPDTIEMAKIEKRKGSMSTEYHFQIICQKKKYRGDSVYLIWVRVDVFVSQFF